MWWHFHTSNQLVEIGCLVHKLVFVATEVVGTVHQMLHSIVFITEHS